MNHGHLYHGQAAGLDHSDGQVVLMMQKNLFFLIKIFFLLFFSFIFISRRLITLQYCNGFCHTLT